MFIERVAFRSPTAPRLVIGVPDNTVFYFSLFIIQGTQFSISRNEVLYSTVQQSPFCGDFALPIEQQERDHVGLLRRLCDHCFCELIAPWHMIKLFQHLFTEVHQTQQRVHWFFSNPILDVPRRTTTHRLHYENMLSLTYFLDGRKRLCINTIYV